ncbi:hypothetical protein BN940_11576 [Castellaniella defragrans 65Phen]|uniref:Uncharacterized protein n=1 Tax=Castellaniella defragrans (strain DSM 12143 / CCUG 39792 / 65Phen) TaxID=1437824 RepID=W8WYF6_CASD6|nr:DUF6516 family protein [Castellaniella defragrans]CDM24773.1 hypothetical protein BN940_11576 [Castellaniella defragrans 65Phen]
MFGYGELSNLIETAGVYPMENGWQVVIRADWVDATPQQPHGIDYALILQDEHGNRIFGFDNAHAYDNAQAEDCWDHEHKVGRVGQRFRYDFVSGSQLITDFFEMLNSYCTLHGVTANFISDDEHE